MTSDSDFDMVIGTDFNRHIFIPNDDKGNIYNVGMHSVPSINSIYSDSEDIPSSYDSRDYGYITPVKNQKDGQNCWAFAGIATLEACIKKITGITYDFSEENMKNRMAAFSTMGLAMNPNYGGYDSMVMGYLASWFGPTLESLDAYDDLSSISLSFRSEFHIHNILFLPPRENGLNEILYLDPNGHKVKYGMSDF